MGGSRQRILQGESLDRPTHEVLVEHPNKLAVHPEPASQAVHRAYEGWELCRPAD